MKKLYLALITIITIICVIGGTFHNLRIRHYEHEQEHSYEETEYSGDVSEEIFNDENLPPDEFFNEYSLAILKVQSKLYRAKTFVDFSVVVALSVVLFSKNIILSHYFDLIGTIVVSLYLVLTGGQSFIKEVKNNKY